MRQATPVPDALLRISEELDRWRRRRSGRALPPRIWRRAAGAACRYGVSRTAHALGLNYSRLRGLASARRRERRKAAVTQGPFVEFFPPASGAWPDCGTVAEGVAEFERPDGGKLRFRFQGVEAAALEALSRAFFGARA